jgi:hypothetical protein
MADDDACSVLSLARLRRGGAPPATLAAPTTGVSRTAILARYMKNVEKMMRPIAMGAGLRIRACVLCGRMSDSRDRVLSEESFLIFPEKEDDGVTIRGFSDKYCNDMLRRRFKGWTQQDLADEMRANEEVKSRFHRLVDQSVEGYLTGSVRISEHMLDPPAQTVSSSDKLKLTYNLSGFLVWSTSAFFNRFGPQIDPVRDMSAKWHSEKMPDGALVEGWLTDDDGVRPLAPGVVAVGRTFEKVNRYF